MTSQARIWNYYQNEHPESFSWGRPRHRFLLRRALRELGRARASVLTVGAGDGFVERGLVEAGHRVVNLDLDEETAARMRDLGVEGHAGELKDFDGGPFRVAVASEVLEHIPDGDLEASVAAVWRALEPGGLFLVTVPFQEDLARSTTICPHCGETHHLWGHRQSFDQGRLESLLSGAGFGRVEVDARFFANYAQLNWGGKATYLAKHLAWRLAKRPSSSLKYVAEARR